MSDRIIRNLLSVVRPTIGMLLILALFVLGAIVSEAQEPGTPCALLITDYQITENGDGDGFADTNETLQIGFTIESRCPRGPRNCVATLYSDSQALDCSRRQEFSLGNLPPAPPAITPEETFELKIGNIDRDDLGLDPGDPLELPVELKIRCDSDYEENYNFPNVGTNISFTIPLDLNLSDLDQTPVPWGEDFESGTLGQFEAQNNDAGLPGNNNAEGIANSEGWNCQYVDPDWINGETYGQAASLDCYPGMNLAQANAIFWQVDGAGVSGSPDGGRAKTGLHSMYYGVFLDQPDTDLFATPMSTVEAVGTMEPVNLGTDSPRLGFWQQLSLTNHRIVADPREVYGSFDRAVVQIQLTDETDATPGFWKNLYPTINPYYSSSIENFWMCAFDPIDDGNTDSDYFDPTDPLRDRGPSSTCTPPQKVWSHQGDTSQDPFDVGNIGQASTAPAASDAPDLGSGTWVRAEIDLTPYRGSRARFRFLVASMKKTAETWHDLFGDLEEIDDGWWIDDIVIDETLADPAVFSNDRFLLGSCAGTGEPCIGQCRLSLTPCSDAEPCAEGQGDCVIPCPPGDICAGPPPDCGANCTQAEAKLFILPDGPFNPESVTTAFPHERVKLHLAAGYDAVTGAEPSWVDVCVDGYKEYRRCVSGDPDGRGPEVPDADCDDAWDSAPSSWRTNGRFYNSPDFDTTYAFEVRCSSAPDCKDGRTLEFIVQCPSRRPNTLGLQETRALNREILVWHGSLDVDWLRGSFTTSADIGDYVADFTNTEPSVTSIPMEGEPPAGTGYYYLVKADGSPPLIPVYNCDTPTWRSGGNAETDEPARNNAFGDP